MSEQMKTIKSDLKKKKKMFEQLLVTNYCNLYGTTLNNTKSLRNAT